MKILCAVCVAIITITASIAGAIIMGFAGLFVGPAFLFSLFNNDSEEQSNDNI